MDEILDCAGDDVRTQRQAERAEGGVPMGEGDVGFHFIIISLLMCFGIVGGGKRNRVVLGCDFVSPSAKKAADTQKKRRHPFFRWCLLQFVLDPS